METLGLFILGALAITVIVFSVSMIILMRPTHRRNLDGSLDRRYNSSNYSSDDAKDSARRVAGKSFLVGLILFGVMYLFDKLGWVDFSSVWIF